MRENIYLTGFMGSGKSTYGRLLADLLNREFIDMDEILVERLRMPITDYFRKHGEASFRQAESALLAELAERERLVVSTGGGVVESESNRRLMKRSGKRVYLQVTWEECLAVMRAADKAQRPMWKDESTAKALLEKRIPFYAEAELTYSAKGKAPEAAAAGLRRLLFADDNFSVRMDGIECPVVCSFHALDSVCAGLSGRKVAILTDKRVANLHLPRYLRRLEEALVIELPGGEGIKSLRTAEKVYRKLLDHHFNRDDLLLAVGGGTVTDLGAYVASTYKRGMQFILASTTLLGCVDAAVGGKAAVNFGEAKNIIGVFTIPEMVVLDAGSFATLPARELSAGLIEAYKTGLVENPKLSALIEESVNELQKGDLPLLKEVAALSARAKAKIVSADFREGGQRAILNFGHTYGHAIEGCHQYKVSHGAAVAAGMTVAVALSRRRKLLAEDEAARITATIRQLCPKLPAWPDLDEALAVMAHDKKIREGKLVFVLLEKAGKPLIINDLKKAELRAAVREAEKACAK